MSTVLAPSGNVTFFFSDVVGSTQMRNRLGFGYQARLCEPHDVLARELAAEPRFAGYVVQDTGDGFFIAFASVKQAVDFAVAFQEGLRDVPLQEVNAAGQVETLTVRMGLHWSREVVPQEIGKTGFFNYKYADTNYAARLNAIANAGQIVLSERTWEELGDRRSEYVWETFGNRYIKDFDGEGHTVYEVCWDGGVSKGEPGSLLVPEWFTREENAFIGRRRVLGEIVEWLRDDKKLMLTLHGPGGVGKTRLAVQSVLQVCGYFSGGTFLVGLETFGASFADEAQEEMNPNTVTPGELADVIAEAVGAPEEVRKNPEALLTPFFQGWGTKKVLLLLDNWESVANGKTVGWLSGFLRAVKNVRCLVTSQRTMGAVQINQNTRLEEMDFPESAGEGLGEFDGYQLFLERARNREPELFVDDGAIVRILKVTEGFPLAIELAAAQVADKGLLDIATGLERESAEWLRVMEEHGDVRDDHRRHWSMESCVHWAVKTLEAKYQEVFPRLGVFPYDFDSRAAQEVCGIEDEFLVEYHRILLLERVKDTAWTRYRLRPTVRRYAWRRLEDETQEAVKGRFADYYAGVLEANEAIDTLEKVEKLHRDWRNVEHIGELYPERLINIANVLYEFFDRRGLWGNAIKLMEKCQIYQINNKIFYDGDIMCNLGVMYLRQGNWNSSEKLFQESLMCYRNAKDNRGVSQVLNNLGTIYILRGEWAKAEVVMKDSLKIKIVLEDGIGKAKILNNLGIIYREQGKMSEAEAMFQASLNISRELGDKRNEGQTLANLGNVYLQQGKWGEAETVFQHDLAICRELGDTHGESQNLGNLSVLYLQQGKWNDAKLVLETSLTISRNLNDTHGEGQILGNLGALYQSQKKWGDAEKYFRESLVICKNLGDRHGEAAALNNLGILYRNLGRWDIANDEFKESISISRNLGDIYGEARTLLNMSLLKYSILLESRQQNDENGIVQNYTIALEMAKSALTVFEKTQNTVSMGKAKQWLDFLVALQKKS